jgi:hypothetical protein
LRSQIHDHFLQGLRIVRELVRIDGHDLINMGRQKNSWVTGGSGSFPSV